MCLIVNLSSVSTFNLNCQLAQVNLSSVEASLNQVLSSLWCLVAIHHGHEQGAEATANDEPVLGGGQWNAANDDAATSNGPYDAALHDDASPTTNGDATTANGNAATTNGDPVAPNGDASNGNATYDASTATSIASHGG